MQTEIIEDAKVLLPNKEHKSFTHGEEVIKKGTTVDGEPKMVQGLKKGQEFTYRLFRLNNGQLIYLNKTSIPMINTMKKTEVTLSADASQSATVVNVAGPQRHLKDEITGLVIGGLVGFIWAKYKKHSLAKSGAYTLIGGGIGYAIGYYFDKKHDNVTVKKSK